MRKEFIEAVTNAVQDLMPNMEVSVQEIIKNNDVKLHGLTIKSPDSDISPAIYLENLVTDGKEPNNVMDLAEKIADTYYQNMANTDGLNDVVTMIKDFDKVKPLLRIRLVNKALNAMVLAQTPHIDFLDMAIYVVVELKETDDGIATIKVNNEMLSQWGKTLSEILPFANENTFNIPYKLQSMVEIMAEMLGMPAELIEAMDESPAKMYVLSNHNTMHGATMICNYNIMMELANRFNADLIVLPSSVHEVIIVPMCDEINIDDMTRMVQEVNSSEVRPDEVLSNHAYVFTRENGWER